MRKNFKRIASWMCVMLMAVTMVLPALADDAGTGSETETTTAVEQETTTAAEQETTTEASEQIWPTVAGVSGTTSATTAAVENLPDVVGISYRGSTSGVPIATKDSTPLEITINLKNNLKGTKTTNILKEGSYVVISNGTNSYNCALSSGYSSNTDENLLWYPGMSVPSDAPAGEYTITGVIVKYETGVTKTFNVSDMSNHTALKLTVSDVAQNLGEVQIGMDTSFSDKTVDVTIDNGTPEVRQNIYFKTTGTDTIKSVRFYFKGKNNTFSSQGSVRSDDEGYLYSQVRLYAGISTDIYRIKYINITTTNGITVTYYNANISEYADETYRFNSDAKINFTNNVGENIVALQNLKLMYLGTSTSRVTVNTSSDDKTVEMQLEVSMRSESSTTLQDLKLTFTDKEGDTFTKNVSNLQTMGSKRYYECKITVDGDQAAGTYKLTKAELTSNKGETTIYSNSPSDGEFTLPANRSVVVKSSDSIAKDEIGSTPKSAAVSTSGTVKTAQIALPTEATVDTEVTDDVSRSFAKETYNFAVESTVIPANTTVEIGKVLTGGILDNAKALVKKDEDIASSNIRVFEISLIDTTSNAKVDNDLIKNGTVSITTDVPTGFDANKTVVYRVDEDGQGMTLLTSTLTEDGKITFETNRFSTYVVAETNSGAQQPTTTKPGGGNGGGDGGSGNGGGYIGSDDNDDVTLVAKDNASNAGSVGTSNTSDTTQSGKSEKTGDTAPVAMFALAAMVALTSFAGVALKKKSER